MDNQTDNKKNIHWFVIDDDIRVLKNMHAELKAGGINEAHIHCLRPQGREAFREFKLRPKFWIQDESVVPDWEYIVEEWRYTVAVWGQGDKEFIRVNTQTLSSLLNEVTPEGIDTYFVFFIDIQYADHNEDGSEILCDYCGFDIFRSIRWMIKPELYIARFLSHLSRRLMQGFINNEYSELKIGSEKSKKKSQSVGDKSGKRPNAMDDFRIDMGFFSKASFRKTPNVTETINILNKYTIDCIQDALPREVPDNSIFGIYNNSYPQNMDKISWDNNKIVYLKDGVIDLALGKKEFPQKTCKKTRLFKSREIFLRCVYEHFKSREIFLRCVYEHLKKRNTDNGNISIYYKNKSNNTTSYKRSPNITLKWGKSTQGTINNGMHFYYNYKKIDNTISLDFSKIPLYREELQKWYDWNSSDTSSESEKVVDILFIGEKIYVEIAGCNSDSNEILSIKNLDKLEEKINRLRPKYLVANIPKEKGRKVLQAIKEVTNCVPKFEIHGFGVYLYDPDNRIAGVNNCCKLPQEDKFGIIRITNPISPIYWKLICLLDLENQEDKMAHNLVYKLDSLTSENWEIAKQELSDTYKLKYLLTKNESYDEQCQCILKSKYDSEQNVWDFNGELIKKHKELFKRLGLTRTKESPIHWVLVSDKDELETALKSELNTLSKYPLISNDFNFDEENQFHRWKIQEIKTKGELKEKLADLKTKGDKAGEPSFVFLFDTMVPVYKHETEKKVTTAIQVISACLKSMPLAFRILFTYGDSEERNNYFMGQEYLTLGNQDGKPNDKIWKNARQVAKEKGNLFCYYPDSIKSDSSASSDSSTSTVSIISPDILYFIQEDLEAQPHKVLNSTLCTPELRKRFAEEHSQEIAKWYKDSTSIINDKVSKLKKLGKNPDFTKIAATLFCTFTGYRIPENESLNFFKDRLILLSYYVNRDLLENVEDKETDFSVNYLWAMWVLKKYSFSLCQKNPSEKEKNYKIKWNELFEHEKKINFDMIIRKFSNESLLEKIGELAVEIDKLFTEYASTKDKKIWKQSESANEVEKIMRKFIGQYFYIPENGFNAYDFLKDLDLLRNDQGQS